MNDHEWQVVNTMKEYGGSFVQALAECFFKADVVNFAKLRITFSEYWDQYEKMLTQIEGRKKS